MILIDAKEISVRRGGSAILDGVSLTIRPGEIVTVLGPNGSGKSTLMKALVGALPLAAGQIERMAGLRLGYVPQKLAIDGTLPLTVRRFLSLPVRVSDAEAETALARTGMAGFGNRQVAGLSGGQLQRVLLARALLSQPHLLILDEPTQGLDQQGEAAFYRLIEELRAETGAAILMVSHDLHVVMAASDRVICLNGHICCQGTPEAVSSAPEYRALFGLGTRGALALYRHEHDHGHDHDGHGHGGHGHGSNDHSGHEHPHEAHGPGDHGVAGDGPAPYQGHGHV